MLAFQSLLSLALIFVIVFFLYNSYRVDLLRQQLFQIRDQLFDEAAAGRIAFDSRAYYLTRTVLNGMIRFSHRLSWTRLIVGTLVWRSDEADEPQARFKRAMSASSEADRQLCTRYIGQANRALLWHLAKSPYMVALVFPLVLLVVSTIVCYAMGRSVYEIAAKSFKQVLASIDLLAYEEGELSQRAVRHTSRHAMSTRF